eukprot:CAMPEP_0171124960 /NCGR_PEP_ID=MMETSP0766_2-20121228/110293_1 /TAXON_ID=439317 /ORGANISM="Gambierdiscus australes, Strain CAWD 149" /LENGTH=72 /DNA_ID=CAMNT_0011587919 /DNA_START=567 /DNA_END=781 /DNA_ORIENTATION=+
MHKAWVLQVQGLLDLSLCRGQPAATPMGVEGCNGQDGEAPGMHGCQQLNTRVEQLPQGTSSSRAHFHEHKPT